MSMPNFFDEFDIIGETARDATWKILNYYCDQNPDRNITLIDTRDPNEVLLTAFKTKDPNNYPYGEVFYFAHKVEDCSSLFTKKRTRFLFKILIDTSKIVRIKGRIDFLFTIYSRDFKIIFGKDIEVRHLKKRL